MEHWWHFPYDIFIILPLNSHVVCIYINKIIHISKCIMKKCGFEGRIKILLSKQNFAPTFSYFYYWINTLPWESNFLNIKLLKTLYRHTDFSCGVV